MSDKSQKPDPVENNDKDDDLEDGELDDSDDEAVIETKLPPAPVKIDREPIDEKLPADKIIRNPFSAKQPAAKGASRDIDRSEDDWICNVEHSIAMALKKEGVEPPAPPIRKVTIESKSHDSDTERKVSKGSRKRKRKRENRERDSELKKKIKAMEENMAGIQTAAPYDDIDEYEMLGIRGGSPPPFHPPHRGSSPAKPVKSTYESDDSYSSYDGYEERRRNRRGRGSREKTQSSGHSRKQRRGHDESDDGGDGGGQTARRGDGPRKQELCKFYLMECCAKREKCLYMHGDFPCKYYYLGMTGHNQDNCKFCHGKPLNEQLRIVLLKHLETAPKEILGDFPRLSREKAIVLLNAQHQKLVKEFGMADLGGDLSMSSQLPIPTVTINPPPIHAPPMQTINVNGVPTQVRIPSLMELVTQVPDQDELGKPQIKPAVDGGKQRKTRWCEPTTTTQSSDYMSIQNLSGIITSEQIEQLTKIGVHSIDQMNQLRVAELNELGISISQIHEVQLNMLNMKKLGLGGGTLTTGLPAAFLPNATSTSPKYDLDMRPQLRSSLPTDPIVSSTPEIMAGKHQDVDMRVLGPSAPAPDPSINYFDVTQYAKDANVDMNLTDDLPSYGVQIGKRDETLAGRDDDDDDDTKLLMADDDEPSDLQIDESIDSADRDADDWLHGSDSIDRQIERSIDLLPAPILPVIYDPSALFPSMVGQKIDISASVTNMIKQQQESDGRDVVTTPTTASSFPTFSTLYEEGRTDPREAMRAVQTPRYADSSDDDSSTGSTPKRRTKEKRRERRSVTPPSTKQRTSIYDARSSDSDSNSDEETVNRASKDRDMRLRSLFLTNDSSNGDIDFRLPFKPVMANYIPATEIDASITSHPPITYRVKECYIPKPDYTEIKRQTAASDSILDPRLRRILSLKESVAENEWSPSGNQNDSDDGPTEYYTPGGLTTTPFQPATSKQIDHTKGEKSGSQTARPIAMSRLDPRRRKVEQQQQEQKPSRPVRNLGFDVQLELQKSAWYTNLNSKHKIMVNQQLALVTAEMKKFQADPNPDKCFDMSFLQQNAFVQQILTNINVYINENGQFVHLNGSASGTDEAVPPPNFPIDFGQHVRFLPPTVQQMFPNQTGDIRPGLLGIAPGIPTPYAMFGPAGDEQMFDGFQSQFTGLPNFAPPNFHFDERTGRGGNNYRNNQPGRGNPFQAKSGGDRWARTGTGGNQAVQQSGRGGGGSRRNFNDRRRDNHN